MTKGHPPCNKPRTKCCQSLSKRKSAQLAFRSSERGPSRRMSIYIHLIFSPHFFTSFFSACSAETACSTEKNLAAAQNFSHDGPAPPSPPCASRDFATEAKVTACNGSNAKPKIAGCNEPMKGCTGAPCNFLRPVQHSFNFSHSSHLQMVFSQASSTQSPRLCLFLLSGQGLPLN